MDDFDIDDDEDVNILSIRAADMISSVVGGLISESAGIDMPKEFAEAAVFHGGICSIAASMKQIGVEQEEAMLLAITSVLNVYSSKKGMN